jgi:hypothetical protein
MTFNMLLDLLPVSQKEISPTFRAEEQQFGSGIFALFFDLTIEAQIISLNPFRLICNLNTHGQALQGSISPLGFSALPCCHVDFFCRHSTR